MIALLLAIVVHVGGGPSEWQPVGGVPSLEYRWSLPYSNACQVEFLSKDTTSAHQFQLVTRVLSARPSPQVEANPDNPMNIAPTRVKPQTSDRDLVIQVPIMGRTSQMVHNCYGIQAVETRGIRKDGTTTSEPLTEGRPR